MLRLVLHSHLPLRIKVALYKELHPFLSHVRSTSIVRALLHITEEEDPSSIKHYPTDDRGSETCIVRRMYDITDQGPHEFLRNIAPMNERSPSLPNSPQRTPQGVSA
ncbi:hypothetical protein EVAR_91201_1 [Eumeta japonica]|uniref:Uncharacterized protein n=1 Tax=Eumeta variegata TaxID=151549 RepID=A0A4C1ZMX4_EUMVA|nr:hypothetical protein EVAR_91201_1 [Eumeta japonica]